MSDKRQVKILSPAIRFREFTDPWRECQLSKGMKKYTDRVYIDDLQFYNQVSIKNTGEIVLRSKTKGSQIGRKRQAKIRLDEYPETLLFTRQTIEQGGIGFAPETVNNAIVTENMPTIAVDPAVFNKNFLMALFKTNQFRIHAILPNVTGGTAQISVHERNLLRTYLGMPAILEQRKIGLFLQLLDNLIASNQRKDEILKDLKKVFLQKMFVGISGKKLVPDIRFSGYTDAWKQRKLGDNSVIKGRLGWKNLKHEEYTASGPSMVSGRYIESGEIDWQSVDHIPEWRYEESPEIMLQNGDIIFTKDGSRLGNPAVISNLQIKATINSTMMLVRTDKTISPYFLYQVLCGSRFERLIHQKVSGSGVPHLFQADMKEFMFKSPTIAEQSLVSKLLFQLDSAIATNQRKGEILKSLKKALLQKMFV